MLSNVTKHILKYFFDVAKTHLRISIARAHSQRYVDSPPLTTQAEVLPLNDPTA